MIKITDDMVDAGREALYEDAVHGPGRAISFGFVGAHDAEGIAGDGNVEFREAARLVLEAAKRWEDAQ